MYIISKICIIHFTKFIGKRKNNSLFAVSIKKPASVTFLLSLWKKNFLKNTLHQLLSLIANEEWFTFPVKFFMEMYTLPPDIHIPSFIIHNKFLLKSILNEILHR